MTENEIPFGEAWLMETALEAHVPLRMLRLDHESLEQQFNQPTHRMDRRQLTATMVGMFDRGELTLDDDEDAEDVVYTAADLVKALMPRTAEEKARARRPLGLYYGLSPLGASRWERWAQPDWRRFCSGPYLDREVERADYTEPYRGKSELFAVDEQRIDEILARAGELWDYQIIHSVERERLEPFEATYWKTPPHGYRVRFHWETPSQRVSDRQVTRETIEADRQFLLWHRSVMKWPDDWCGFQCSAGE